MKVLMVNGKEILLEDPRVEELEFENKAGKYIVVYDGNDEIGKFYRINHWIIFDPDIEEKPQVDKELVRLSVMADIARSINRQIQTELEKRWEI